MMRENRFLTSASIFGSISSPLLDSRFASFFRILSLHADLARAVGDLAGEIGEHVAARRETQALGGVEIDPADLVRVQLARDRGRRRAVEDARRGVPRLAAEERPVGADPRQDAAGG